MPVNTQLAFIVNMACYNRGNMRQIPFLLSVNLSHRRGIMTRLITSNRLASRKASGGWSGGILIVLKWVCARYQPWEVLAKSVRLWM